MIGAGEHLAEIRSTLEKCLRAALPPETPLPVDDQDWIESGLLDSMAHVDLLLAIETALNRPKLFARLGVPQPTTLRAALETISSTLAASASTNIQDSCALLSAAPMSSSGLVGWGSALGPNRIPIHEVEQSFHLSSPVLAIAACAAPRQVTAITGSRNTRGCLSPARTH